MPHYFNLKHSSGIRQHTSFLSFYCMYSSKATAEKISNYNPADRKITQFRNDIFVNLPMSKEWETINPIFIKKTKKSCQTENRVHYFCGGLPALMQAARKTIKLSREKRHEHVMYVNDGLIPKTLQSGHQAHVHPSEWSTENCSAINLFKTLLRGMGIFAKQDPADLNNYSYLHFPFSLNQFLKNPWLHFNLNARFFKQRIVHNLSCINDVSQDDRWLCRSIVESLEFHKELSDLIQKQQGAPSFTQCSRYYWSPNVAGMQKKEKIWNALDIDCKFVNEEEIRNKTLLKDKSGLHVLKITQDGKFYPDTMQRIIRYLKENFSQSFTHQTGILKELHLDDANFSPLFIEHQILDKKEKIAIQSFFGSLGHNQVFITDDRMTSKSKALWFEVPVSGNSTIWKCTIDKKELMQRFGYNFCSNEHLKTEIKNILPTANLSNLHVTCWEGEISDNDVIIYLRVSQGANFNSLIADKDDLKNMFENLDRFFIGKWEIISAGTCTRKTYFSNVPEYVELSKDSEHPATFLHGLSGIGYSFSATSLETIKQRPEKS